MVLIRALDRLCRLLTMLGAAALAVMMLATALDVILRTVANQPIRGVVDLVEIAVLLAIFLGLPEAFRRDEQITVDLVDRLVPPFIFRLFRAFGALASAFFMYLLTVNLIEPVVDAYSFGDSKTDLDVPLYPFLAIALFCVAVSLLTTLVVLFGGFAQPTEEAGLPTEETRL